MEDNFQNICHDIIKAENSSDINNSLNRFCNILDGACSPLFKKSLNSNKRKPVNENFRKNMPFFDSECKNLKQSYYKCLNMYRNNTCDENRVEMVRARSDYKKNY